MLQVNAIVRILPRRFAFIYAFFAHFDPGNRTLCGWVVGHLSDRLVTRMPIKQ
ncbi:hypothetical protein [Tolypothrix sp. NIES-4075]|uniref:hypothetical protein n=1 Tax=Tolypothrix sp. NIES-4075 TaxID=2005459 RepID=UPI00135AE5DB|nr:hypothetical protein [Tolypothrix sp. NIES-4075]